MGPTCGEGVWPGGCGVGAREEVGGAVPVMTPVLLGNVHLGFLQHGLAKSVTS